ncbi:carbohydrate binding [Blomia tropicalis]|nr:carbohydrate binding [Blomia tropicalis]
MNFCLIGLLFLLNQFNGLCSVRIELENLPEQCDYSKCTEPDDDKVNVHLVPHTHDDVGWLKTVDQYYYGSHSNVQNAGVQYILDSVVEALVFNKERRFIYVEVAFFAKWWDEQDNKMKAIVTELVRSGQLEFINGGWCMNDEATTHYNSIIDQMTLGLRFLNDTFGRCGIPRVAWQIDPFGHSREQANLFAQMNFDGLFFSRIDFEDKFNRRANRQMEMVWHGSDDLGSSGDLFTSVMNNGYGPPEGFNWDLIGGVDEPVIDNPKSEEYNVEKIVEAFVATSLFHHRNYATNQILFPMGSDFHYQDANILFKNMDKLIKHVNSRQSKVKVFYSTPSCYLKALNNSGHIFPTKNDDFFPYASDEHALWTGYFTSRPTLKRMERVGNNWLQACKQIDVLSDNKGKYESMLRSLKESMGIMQHHDAVAGTEKQNVAFDYAKLLQIGIDQCKKVINYGFKKAIAGPKYAYRKRDDFQFCDHLNISSCYATETYHNFMVTLYNPLGHTLYNHTVRLPFNRDRTSFIEVLGPNHENILSTIIPIPKWVRSTPGRNGNASHELVFDVNIPALGFVSYFIKRTNLKTENSAIDATKLKITKPINLPFGGKSNDIDIDEHGKIKQISFDDRTFTLENDFFYYEGHTGNNKFSENRSSGAYIFRPKTDKPIRVGNLVQSILYSDNRRNLFEIHQRYDSFVHQTIRLYPNKPFIEFDWYVESIPIDDKIGKEIVTRYSTNLINDKTFYTDANGRQILERKQNYRPTWNYTVFEPISSNYYPVNSRIFIRDQMEQTQFTILTDRTQGGTSLNNGEIELMLHRRLLHDDAFGVDEALNETGPDGNGLVVRGSHYLLLNDIVSSTRLHRELSQQLYLKPILGFMPKFNNHKSATRYQTVVDWMPKLPENVHILTLEQWNSKQILIRLENFYQKNENHQNSKATVSIKNILPEKWKILNVEELTLGANQKVESIKQRLQFRYKDNNLYKKVSKIKDFFLEIHLDPMQIRTFLITIDKCFKIVLNEIIICV